jgi:hypothetical protein
LYNFIGGIFSTRLIFFRKYKLPDEVYFLDMDDRGFAYTDVSQRLLFREVRREWKKQRRFLRRKRTRLRRVNKRMRFHVKRIKKFYYAFKVITPIIKSFFFDSTNRFVLERDADPLSARIGYDIGKTASYEPYTENVYDFKLENAVRASFHGLFSTYDMLTFDYDWEMRQEILWDENDFFLFTEVIDIDLFQYEAATPKGYSKNEQYNQKVYDPLVYQYYGVPALYSFTGKPKPKRKYIKAKVNKIADNLEKKFKTIVVKILTNIISFGETEGVFNLYILEIF